MGEPLGSVKQPAAQRGRRMDVRYKLYALTGDGTNFRSVEIARIGINKGKAVFDTINPEFEKTLDEFVLPDGSYHKKTDSPEKYFKALEARFTTASRLILTKVKPRVKSLRWDRRRS